MLITTGLTCVCSCKRLFRPLNRFPVYCRSLPVLDRRYRNDPRWRSHSFGRWLYWQGKRPCRRTRHKSRTLKTITILRNWRRFNVKTFYVTFIISPAFAILRGTMCFLFTLGEHTNKRLYWNMWTISGTGTDNRLQVMCWIIINIQGWRVVVENIFVIRMKRWNVLNFFSFKHVFFEKQAR